MPDRNDYQAFNAFSRILLIIDAQLAEARHEERAHQELQRRSDRLLRLRLDGAGKTEMDEAVAAEAIAKRKWNSIRRERLEKRIERTGELFPTFDEFPLGIELLRWGTARGIPPAELRGFRD